MDNKEFNIEFRFSLIKCIFLFLISFIWVRKVVPESDRCRENIDGLYRVNEREIHLSYRRGDENYGWTIVHERVHAGQHLLSLLGLHRPYRQRIKNRDPLALLYVEMEAEFITDWLLSFTSKEDRLKTVLKFSVLTADRFKNNGCYEDAVILPSQVAAAYFPKDVAKLGWELRKELMLADCGYKTIVGERGRSNLEARRHLNYLMRQAAGK